MRKLRSIVSRFVEQVGGAVVLGALVVAGCPAGNEPLPVDLALTATADWASAEVADDGVCVSLWDHTAARLWRSPPCDSTWRDPDLTTLARTGRAWPLPTGTPADTLPRESEEPDTVPEDTLPPAPVPDTVLDAPSGTGSLSLLSTSDSSTSWRLTFPPCPGACEFDLEVRGSGDGIGGSFYTTRTLEGVATFELPRLEEPYAPVLRLRYFHGDSAVSPWVEEVRGPQVPARGTP